MTDQAPTPPAAPSLGAALAGDIAQGAAALNTVGVVTGAAVVAAGDLAEAVKTADDGAHSLMAAFDAHGAGYDFLAKLSLLERKARAAVLADLGFVEREYQASPAAFFGGVAVGAVVAIVSVLVFYGLFH